MLTVPVRTSQNVIIDYPVASIGERIGAYLIDRLIVAVYAVPLVVFFLRINQREPWIWLLTLAVPAVFFSVLFEIFMNGQTPGKRLFKIQVVRLDGSRASVGDYLLRWIFAILDVGFLGGVIAIIAIAAGGKGQRLGDLAAGTTVVKLATHEEVFSTDIFITADDRYVPIFAQAIQLNARDIELMHRALEAYDDLDNPEPLELIAEKARLQFGIQSKHRPDVLIRILIKDHSHLTSK